MCFNVEASGKQKTIFALNVGILPNANALSSIKAPLAIVDDDALLQNNPLLCKNETITKFSLQIVNFTSLIDENFPKKHLYINLGVIM